ncbi:hypothetical protein [Paracoccus tibetensis]|uniref:Uncharacterized protein n=1 Tax=Paracoccus tibetensis TaxID=336292 RepID=A0A1G5BD95_9RHOB|nr:hypothetical protein [Paracoccus tibetensis]SCX88099.1 hypothetical protein SAMN05660710_00097 [Paracoccus tibetensis]
MAKCTHLAAAIQRHTTAGSLLLLMFSVIIFGPRLWDTIRGEPWIENKLAIVQNSSGAIVVEDAILTRGAVHGLRANTVEAEDGSVLCSTEHHNTWLGERNRFWRIQAFTGCPPPSDPYRICSRFVIASDSGRQRYFGPFCSGLAKPE